MASRALIPDAPLLDDQGRITTPWLQVFRLWGVTVTAARQSGPTAERPTAGVWVGFRYYDTDLNKPVYVYNVAMVSGGSGGWADAAGFTA